MYKNLKPLSLLTCVAGPYSYFGRILVREAVRLPLWESIALSAAEFFHSSRLTQSSPLSLHFSAQFVRYHVLLFYRLLMLSTARAARSRLVVHRSRFTGLSGSHLPDTATLRRTAIVPHRLATKQAGRPLLQRYRP